MKKYVAILILTIFLITAPGCASSKRPPETVPAVRTTVPLTEEPSVPKTVPEPVPAPVEPPNLIPAEPVLHLSQEEKEMLLKIGMAERGSTGCAECIALVMCTVINRVESGRFGSSIRSVLFSPEQFTPVMTGAYYNAKPNENCYDALEMVVYGWDESQGALYYEWCDGESWHSQNLHLLQQHCDVRFYD